MSTDKIPFLLKLFQSCQSQIPQLTEYETRLETLLQSGNDHTLDNLPALYDEIYPLVEQELWAGDDFDTMLELYQGLFREQDTLISQSGTGERYDFILSITIADRPEHLRGCLESIYQQCRLFGYGGQDHGLFSKITVIVVEDSKEQKHIDQDRQLAEEYTRKGLQVHHYGQREQYDLMLEIPADLRQAVSSIIGDPATENFYHKGQAVTRNLAYLKALQLSSRKQSAGRDKTLYYLVDSDQQFRVNRPTADGDEYVYGLNFFYYINRIFKEHDIAMLTGKLVCDPPVSPSVMAANFLDDVIAFMQQLSTQAPEQPCSFHPQQKTRPDDAAYHDMAHLFGLGSQKSSYDYCCPLNDAHNHIDCLKNFAERVNYFFFGEHLTRKTYYSYSSATEISPARTIYPGNYIATFDGLKYIIPFGKLRLRMSGPTAGRLIQAEINERFASVNLPMLHARTLQSDFNNEYRPGVEDNKDNIDLSDEFERQFFGDLMLFTVEKLVQSGVAIEAFTQQVVSEAFATVEQELLKLYEDKHNRVRQKCHDLSLLVNNDQLWWQQCPEVSDYLKQLQQFINNIQHNFGARSKAYQQIQSSQHRQKRVAQMLEALLNYRRDRDAWDTMLSQFLH